VSVRPKTEHEAYGETPGPRVPTPSNCTSMKAPGGFAPAPLSRLIFLGIAGIVAALILGSRPARTEPQKEGRDIQVYRQMVARLRTHEPYYTVIGDELRRGHYGTKEIFHWRTPLHWSALAALPQWASWLLIIMLGAGICLGTFAITAELPGVVFWTAMALQMGAVVAVIAPDAVYFPETWCGLLIGASVCAFLLNRSTVAVAFGLLALLIRELAAPYCVVAVLLAVWWKRWREVALWVAAACVYAAYFSRHVVQVLAHQRADDLSAGSWVALGGLPFVLSTVQAHLLGFLWPAVTAPIAFVLILSGIMSRGTPAIVRLTSATYMAMFLIVGKPFDNYWGLVVWPVWAFAGAFGLSAVVNDIRNLRRPSPAPA
jgi:hypothetical protein